MIIYYLVLIAILNHIAFAGSRVAVSLLALELGANQFAIGVIIALYSLCPVLLSIAIGKFVDRASAGRPVVVATLIMAAALTLPVLVPGLAMLYVVALLLGLSHQLFLIPLEATVGGIGGPEQRARNYAILTMGWSLASFLGPFLTGIAIDYIGHVQAFVLLLVFTVAPLLIQWLMPQLLSKTARQAPKDAVSGSVLDLWRIPSLRLTIIIAGVVGSAHDLFQFYLPIYGYSVGLSASAIGAILGTVSVAAFIIRFSLPFLLNRLTEARILTAAVFIAAGAYVLIPFFTNAWMLAAIAFLLGLGVGCAQPLTMSLLYALTPPGRVAEAIGLHKTVRNATHIAVPIFFGSIGAAFGFVTVFLSNAALLATSGLLMRRTRMPGTGKRPPG